MVQHWIERIEPWIFINFYICGLFLCIIPILCKGIDHSSSSVLSRSLNSKYVLLGITASSSVCSYVILEEVLGYFFNRMNQISFKKMIWLFLLISLLFPNTIYLILISDKKIAGFIPSVFCSQRILVYISLSKILYDTGQPVWDKQALFLSMVLIMTGSFLKFFGNFHPNCFPLWMTNIPFIATLILFYSKLIRWIFVLGKKKTSKNQLHDDSSSGQTVILFLYTIVIILTTSFGFNFKYEVEYEVSDLCIHIYSITALVLMSVGVRNYFHRRSLERFQVSTERILNFTHVFNMYSC